MPKRRITAREVRELENLQRMVWQIRHGLSSISLTDYQIADAFHSNCLRITEMDSRLGGKCYIIQDAHGIIEAQPTMEAAEKRIREVAARMLH